MAEMRGFAYDDECLMFGVANHPRYVQQLFESVSLVKQEVEQRKQT